MAPILYGMPAYNEEMQRKLDKKELVLGGCCITGADPEYHCFGCYRDVCKPPVLISARGREDYRDIVTSVQFFRWPSEGASSSVWIKKMGDGVFYVEAYSGDGFVRRGVKEPEWKRLLNTLYGKLYLHEWKKRYEGPQEPGGEEWLLEITLTDGRIRTYRGRGAYPPYWKELQEAFRPFLRRPAYPLRGSGRPTGKSVK